MNKETEYKIGDLFQKPRSKGNNNFYHISGILIAILKNTNNKYAIEWYYQHETITVCYTKNELDTYCFRHGIYDWEYHPANI